MILKKIIIDGKEVFTPISFDEALNYDDKDNLVFTDEDEKDDFFDTLDDIEEESDEEHIDNESSDFNIGKLFSGLVNLGKKFKDKANSKESKFIKMLPFMDEETIYEIACEILNGSQVYEEISLETLFPFLSEDDLQKLFFKFVEATDDKMKKYVVKIAPFVSSETLTMFVDGYIDGKYQDVKVDLLYPFMKSKDIKRIFKYVMNKK